MGQYSRFTYDAALALRAIDAQAMAAAEAGAGIVDLGAGLVCANLVLDVTAVEVATGDEVYTICLEGSNVAAMTSGSVCLAQIEMGNAGAPADADTGIGRFVVPFRNEQNDTVYRYVRLYTRIAGTVVTGIDYSAFIAME